MLVEATGGGVEETVEITAVSPDWTLAAIGGSLGAPLSDSVTTAVVAAVLIRFVSGGFGLVWVAEPAATAVDATG